MRRRAFSLIEMLVVTAVIAALTALLLPALDGARRQAREVACAARLAQLARAFHMYAADYLGRAMPLAYTRPDIIGDAPPIYWWGRDTPDGVDHSAGFVWPYLQSDLRRAGVYECPAQPWGTYRPQGQARAVTSTYGYNGYYLSPPHASGWSHTIGRRPWQNVDMLADPARLFVFADTIIDLGDALPYNNALLDPPYLFSGRYWARNSSPTTAFRHAERTIAACADGHVQAFRPSEAGRQLSRFMTGSAGSDNDPHYVPDWREW